MIKAINSILGKIIGSKSDRDLKEIKPLLDKIASIYPTLAGESNDQLRQRTTNFRTLIQDQLSERRAKIASINALVEANPEMDAFEKERNFEELDKIKKEITAEIEKILIEILIEKGLTREIFKLCH